MFWEQEKACWSVLSTFAVSFLVAISIAVYHQGSVSLVLVSP